MTACDAACGKPGSTNSAVLFQRLYGVCRTRRKVAARWWQQRTDTDLICAYEQHENSLHAVVLTCCASTQCCEFVTKRVKRSAVRRRKRKHNHGANTRSHESLRPNDLAKTPFDSIAIHRRMRVPGHDDPDAWRRCCDRSELKHRAACPLAFCPNGGEISAASQSFDARKAKTATLLRTSTAASLSGAYAPSCGAGSVPPAPTS